MSLDGRENAKVEIRHDRFETIGEFLLLMQRKQKIGFDTDHQSAVELQTSQSGGNAAAVIGGVE